MQVEFLLLRYVHGADSTEGPNIGLVYHRISLDPWMVRCEFKNGWKSVIQARDELVWIESLIDVMISATVFFFGSR